MELHSKIFSDNVRLLMPLSGYSTQKELAEELGISNAVLSNLLTNKTGWSLDLASDVALQFGCKITTLLEEDPAAVTRNFARDRR